MLKYLQVGDVFYDLGANVGFYTLLAATVVGSAGSVYAFEPLPRNLEFLRQHIMLNKIDNVTVYDVAVSDNEGIQNFQTNTGPSMAKLSLDGNVKVNCISLNQFTKEANLRPPNVMKIDIEGAEYTALRGASDLLQKSRIKLFLSVHTASLYEQCRQLLTDLGYTVETLRHRNREFSDELFCYN